MSALRIGIYPGTFDPVTNGHMDIITRATKVVDKLIVSVAEHTGKDTLFSLDERLGTVQNEINSLGSVAESEIEVCSFNSLLMEFAENVNATVIIRGLRAVSDFEYEFQMAGMNARLNNEIETVFLMASDSHQFIASRFVKEIGRLGGDISHFVAPRVRDKVVQRFNELKSQGF
jgi:pantetheine-phosphate adenylyltransferase